MGVFDVFLLIAVIAEAAKEFRFQFPATPLPLYVEAPGGAVQPPPWPALMVQSARPFGLSTEVIRS